MSFILRSPALRGAVLGGGTLILGSLTSSAAMAQCTGAGLNDVVLPLGQGGAINSIISTINTANTAFLTSTSAFVSAPGGPRPDQQGGGVWGRVVGGSVDNESTGTSTILTPMLLGTPGDTRACDTKTRTEFSGFQVGHDISILNGGGSGANFHVGVTAGYFEADTADKTFGTFSGNMQVPFAGIYAAFTKGSWALDGQARWDFYQNTLTDAANGLNGQRFNGDGFSLTGNLAYNIPLQHNWFIEPSIGGIYSRVSLDPLNVPGTVGSGGINAPGTVQINDIESFLGRISLSTGTTISSGGVVWQPFFTASLFHEFAGDVTTDIQTRYEALGLVGIDGTARLSTTRVGTYGQFALGTAAVLGNTGWLGYGRFDYRVGENIDGWSVNAGLRYQFSPGPGQSRRSVKDAPEAARPTYNWTGPYLGLYAGKTVGEQNWFTAALGTSGTNDNPEFGGYLVGGQAGYNLQFGRVVIGVEGDYGFANAEGGKACSPIGANDFSLYFFSCEAELDRLATITGRLGYTWGRALFYAKGGAAFGEVTVQTRENTGAPIPPSNTPVNGETKWLPGWTIGGGMEFALTDRFSAKAEYMHYRLSADDFVIDAIPGGPQLIADTSVRGDTVRIGINYHLHDMRREAAPLK